MEQQPQYFWHEPTLSWKTQEELDQIYIEEQKEIERLKQEELKRQEEELQRQKEEEQKELKRIYDETHKTFVNINNDNVITNIIIASREYMNTNPFGDEIYIEKTDEIKNEPLIGGTYNHELNAFLPPKPYESWIINTETWQWESPIPKPAVNEPGPGKIYVEYYNAYILPPPDPSWVFNEEKLECEPPAT
jgi:hypothetical protein